MWRKGATVKGDSPTSWAINLMLKCAGQLLSIEIFILQHRKQTHIVEDAVLAAIASENAFRFKSKLFVEIRCRISKIVIQIQAFQLQFVEAVVHDELQRLFTVAFAS